MRDAFRIALIAAVFSIVALILAPAAGATLHIVNQVSTTFSPADRTVVEGDTVRWVWSAGSHTVTNGTGAADANAGVLFDAPLNSSNATFEYVFNSAGVYPYFCRPHEFLNMKGTITVDPPSDVRTPGATMATLGRSHPNPFGAETEISYTLGEDAEVRLDVFDARGRRVATLERGFRASGPHRAVWNGTGVDGSRQPAGVYFYRLRAGETVHTRKIVLVR